MTDAGLLTIDAVTMRFGGLTAVDSLMLQVHEGEILGLIGPNGAGKTTVFNMITGVYTPTEGDITFEGKRLNGLRPHKVTRAGLARTFQNIRLFDNMTALDNVIVATHARHRSSVAGAIFGLPRFRAEEREGQERAQELLEFVGIAQRVRAWPPGSCPTVISGGSRSPARWAPRPACSCLTSRPRA